MSLLWKIGGIALACAAAFLLVKMYGGARFNAGKAEERSAWHGKVAEADAARLAGFQLGLARVREGEVQYHETVRDRIVPFTRTIIERSAAYAQTPDGASLCLTSERVQLLATTRSALFPATPAPGTDRSSGSVHSDATGAQPRWFDVQGASGAELRAR